MPQAQQQQPQKMTMEEAYQITYVILHAYRLCVLVFLRRSFGIGAMSLALISFLVLFFLASEYPGFDCYLIAWFILLLYHRAISIYRHFKGVDDRHSRYAGDPWVAMLWPGVKTEDQARKTEPVICLFGGLILATIWPHVGLFVMGSSVACLMCIGIDFLADLLRMQQLKDTDIEVRYYAERYRKGR